MVSRIISDQSDYFDEINLIIRINQWKQCLQIYLHSKYILSLTFQIPFLISDEHDYYERYNEIDYQDYGQNDLVPYSGYEDFSEKQDYGTHHFFQTKYEDLSQKQDNQAFAIDVSYGNAGFEVFKRGLQN